MPNNNLYNLYKFISGGTTLTNGLVTLMVDRRDPLPVENLFFDGANQISAFNDYNELGISPGMFYIYDDIPNYWCLVF
jgi:hypothetical protein